MFQMNKWLIGAVGFGLVGLLGACTPPETPADPTLESPVDSPVDGTDPGVSPLESPQGADPTDPDTAAGDTTNETVVEVIDDGESFNTLQQAIEAANLEDILNEPGPYTVFAPTDEAFAALPPETLDQLLQPENQEQLRQILTYHVVPGSLTSPGIQPGEVSTAQGEPITIADSAGVITVDNAQVIEPDIVASNGVVHGIDQVLLPPSLQVQ